MKAVTAKTNKVSMTELKRRHSADLKAHAGMNRDKVKGKHKFITPRPSIADLQKQNAENILNSHKKDVIFEYIRRNKRFKTYKVGVIIGVKDGIGVRIGWSKCNTKVGDKFDPMHGIILAITRAIESDPTPTPKCVQKQVRHFGARCARYFKGTQKIEFPLNA